MGRLGEEVIGNLITMRGLLWCRGVVGGSASTWVVYGGRGECQYLGGIRTISLFKLWVIQQQASVKPPLGTRATVSQHQAVTNPAVNGGQARINRALSHHQAGSKPVPRHLVILY